MPQLVFEFSVKAALIAGIAAVVLRAVQVKTAAARHAVWVGVMVVMLLLPIWLAWGPKTYLRVLPKTQPALIATAPRMLVNPTLLPMVEASVPVNHPAAPWPNLLLGLYSLGLCVLLVRLAIGTVRAHALARRAVHQGGRLTSASCSAPVTVGCLHPVVILPEHWHQWPPAQMDAVWTHEQEHARRRDPLVKWVALFNRAVFWFHPIAWWIERELSALAEEACDTAVLESGHDPREYSECLLHMARSVMQAGARINVGMTMPGSFLPQRIRKILEGGRAPRVSRTRMAFAVTTCAFMSAALAAGTLAYAPQRETLPRAQQREFDSASLTPPEVRVPEAKREAASGTSGFPRQIGPPHLLAQSQNAPAAQVPPDTSRKLDLPDYLLAPSDQVLVRAPQAAEMDEHPFRIDFDGNINLPSLGRVHAGGMTVRELEGDLVQRLREHLSEPQVSVIVLQFHTPAPVYFVGAFKAPGIYPLQGSGRLVEMLTTMGGLRPDAGGYIKITRKAEYGPIPLPEATEDAAKKVSIVEISVDTLLEALSPADIPLLPLDVVSVEPTADPPAVH